MKIKLKDIKQIVEGVVKEALSEEDPRFGRYKSSMTKTFETVDIEKATRKHAQAMGDLSAALKDALSVGGAVKVMEISKQMEELNRQLEQEIESIIRSYDADARPMKEQEEAPASVNPKVNVKDADKAAEKVDAHKALVALLQFIDTPAEIESFVESLINLLPPNKVTDQEVRASFRNLFKKAMNNELERQGKAAAGN